LSAEGATQNVWLQLKEILSVLTPALFNPRIPSLARANFLVLASVAAAIPLSHYPHQRPTAWLVVPVFFAFVGTFETLRCLQRRWSLHHAGVLLCVYMDLMALSFLLFLLLYPYFLWVSPGVGTK
jgi:hypothetical protein